DVYLEGADLSARGRLQNLDRNCQRCLCGLWRGHTPISQACPIGVPCHSRTPVAAISLEAEELLSGSHVPDPVVHPANRGQVLAIGATRQGPHGKIAAWIGC